MLQLQVQEVNTVANNIQTYCKRAFFLFSITRFDTVCLVDTLLAEVTVVHPSSTLPIDSWE